MRPTTIMDQSVLASPRLQFSDSGLLSWPVQKSNDEQLTSLPDWILGTNLLLPVPRHQWIRQICGALWLERRPSLYANFHYDCTPLSSLAEV